MRDKTITDEISFHKGVSFLSLLSLLFIALKLCHVINWSWWFVTMPLWIVPSIFLAIALLILMFNR